MQPIFEGPDRLLGLPGYFQVVRCVKCGLLRQDPRPTRETISYYYPAEYEPFSIAIDAERSWLRRWDRRYGIKKRQRAIERYCPSGRLLDVGCATGNFLNEMAHSGNWEVEGVEPNLKAAEYGQKYFGLTIHIGELTDIDLPQEAYDVITMWNVFEHLHDPMANLQVIAKLLKPQGWFIFSIPNLESYECQVLGKYWMGWELPRHLYYPTQEQMDIMLQKVGLCLRNWQCLVGAYPSFIQSLRFLLSDIFGNPLITNSVLRIFESFPIRLIMAPLFWLITRTNRASLITGFAQRKI
ncbi:MAG: class I SAM-dependent methyltransferase [Candidatus Methanomethylicaceae archaeon]